MTNEQAIRLLHPDTTAEAIAEIEYKHGFRGKQAAINKIDKACELACKALEKQIPKKPISYDKHYYKCPCCEEDLDIDEDDIYVYQEIPPNFCYMCGQALEWG